MSSTSTSSTEAAACPAGNAQVFGPGDKPIYTHIRGIGTFFIRKDKASRKRRLPFVDLGRSQKAKVVKTAFNAIVAACDAICPGGELLLLDAVLASHKLRRARLRQAEQEEEVGRQAIDPSAASRDSPIETRKGWVSGAGGEGDHRRRHHYHPLSPPGIDRVPLVLVEEAVRRESSISSIAGASSSSSPPSAALVIRRTSPPSHRQTPYDHRHGGEDSTNHRRCYYAPPNHLVPEEVHILERMRQSRR